MASIASVPLPPHSTDPWTEVVRLTAAWGAQHRSISWRDAIVLVPFAQHLPLARRAWADSGIWMPRIETTQTLARSLGPGERPSGTQLVFEGALDRLAARRLFRSQDWATAMSRRDPRGFDHAVSATVLAAQLIARGAAAVPPEERAPHWERARALVAAQAGPGVTERALLRVALEWAAASATPATDALFSLRPSAWIVIQAGGVDALATSLLRTARDDIPCLVIDTDTDTADPFADLPSDRSIRVGVCADFEREAQATATQVLTALERGIAPVALIAQDRLLTRRVRALLARQDVPLQDETGWKLSTTRAAACVASLLRAARFDAGSDDWIDWLKSCGDDWPGVPDAAYAIESLEQALRRHVWSHPAAIDASRLDERSARLLQAAQASLQRLRSTRLQSLAGWLAAMAEALDSCGALRFLRHDDAGRQVLAALHLSAEGAAPVRLGVDEPMTLDAYTDWVDGALEEASFLPAAQQGAPVIVTPLERAMLRPFGAVVLAAADEKRLGAVPAPRQLLSDSVAAALGVPTQAMRRDAETLAFTQLLRVPEIVLLRRTDDGGEPLAASPLLERLELARARQGHRALEPATLIEAESMVRPAPVERPSPRAPGLLPQRLSASACEALRACPYRFFALRLLRLREAEELDDEFEKRDYGTWLHAVLHRFHANRGTPQESADEIARLQAVAREVEDEMGFDAAAFLPFSASFARFAPRYVEWLHARDAAGAEWQDGEVELIARPVEWGGVEMQGIIDRVDSVPNDLHGRTTQLIDYKTGSASALRELLKSPQEDTQLAFYAALVAAQSGSPGAIDALYLPLDESGPIKAIEHVEVEASARRLVAEIGGELARIRNGAALPALGEGRACTYCEARGLCRRDHWAVIEGPG